MRYRPPSKTKPGDRYWRLTAIKRLSTDQYYNVKWLFLCDCGKETIAIAAAVRSGHTQSCGCRSREIHLEVLTTLTHGAAKRGDITPEYMIWQGMIARCENPKHVSFKNYGARGIAVCDLWRGSFSDFIGHIGPRPTTKHSIDRINNDGNYEPGNVRWATRLEQSANRRRPRPESRAVC